MQQISGVNFLIFYAKTFFDEVSGNGDQMNIALGVANFFGGFLCIYMISKFGRRFNLKQCSFNLSVSMLALGIGVYFKFTFLSFCSVIIYMLSFAFGLGGTLPVYCSEMTPASGLGLAVAI